MKRPWRTLAPLRADREYVAVATELVPTSLRSTGRLFDGARRASAQLADAPGAVGFASSAEPLRRRYRTISLWESDADVDAYARSGDHHELVRSLADELEGVRTTRWRVSGDAGRPTWRDALERLSATRT